MEAGPVLSCIGPWKLPFTNPPGVDASTTLGDGPITEGIYNLGCKGTSGCLSINWQAYIYIYLSRQLANLFWRPLFWTGPISRSEGGKQLQVVSPSEFMQLQATGTWTIRNCRAESYGGELGSTRRVTLMQTRGASIHP